MKQSCDLAIIGAGPYGLSLAAHLRARGQNFRIFGKPMDTWASHMPKNMMLKSEGFASNLSTPSEDFTLKAWSKRNGLAYADRSAPIGLDHFLRYSEAFRARFAPELEDVQVKRVERTDDGFALSLDSGERFKADNVVLAVGVKWFAYTPPVLARLRDLVSHSYDHRDVERFRGCEVAVVGTGSSAIDLAHELRRSGASPHIVGRAARVQYNSAPDSDGERLLYRLQNPPSTIGRGWRSYFCAQAPLMFYRLPRHMKERAIKSHMHPAAGWFMRWQVEGVIPMTLGAVTTKARAKDGRAWLTLARHDGTEEVRPFDHVISATGYRVDVERMKFLAPSLRSQIALCNGSPLVSDTFETSVPGLYTIGLSAMEMFGPLLRFMVGAEFVAPRLAAHLSRSVCAPASQRAA
jgi:thioredoxin reductase